MIFLFTSQFDFKRELVFIVNEFLYIILLIHGLYQVTVKGTLYPCLFPYCLKQAHVLASFIDAMARGEHNVLFTISAYRWPHLIAPCDLRWNSFDLVMFVSKYPDSKSVSADGILTYSAI